MKEKNNKIIGAISGFINGLLGTGGGAVSVLGFKRNGMEEKKAHGTSTALILPLSIVSSIIYLVSESIDMKLVLLVSIGGVMGGILGAQLLNRFSNKWVRSIFGLVLVVSGAQILLR